MTRVIKQDILRLQIAINDVESVQAFQGTEQLGRVESRPIDIEALLSLQMMEELSSVDEGKDEIEFFGRLKGKLERHDERIVDLSED